MSTLRRLAATLVLAGAVGLGTPALSADFSDPTWPCIQRKVERLSMGLMWPFPVEENAASDADPALRTEVDELAEALALRRIDLETLAPEVEAFAERHGGDPDTLGMVFERVFATLSKRRARIIHGIGDFSLSQIALSERIDAARLEMDEALTAAAPDHDRIDALAQQLDWDQVIYSDRQRSITYLCETPTLLEKRLFAVAQMLQRVAREDG